MKKNLCLWIIVFAFSGCTFLNILPNPQRDKWYKRNAEEMNEFHQEALDFLRKVELGFTKDQVLAAWGDPWRRKTDDYWLYSFPEYFPNKITVKFENGVVVEKW